MGLTIMERDYIMPYHKDKQQAFQATQQGVTQAENAFNNIVKMIQTTVMI